MLLTRNAAKLIACGAKSRDDGPDRGGISILDAKTRAKAETLIAADPFSRAGLFESVTIPR